MPRNVTVTLSNGNPHTYRNVPDNVTPDQIEQRAAREFPGVRVVSISGGRKAQPAPEKQQPWYQSALSGFERGIKPVADIARRLDPTAYVSGAVTDYFAPGSRQRVENALAAQAQQAQRQNPISYGGGKLVGNIVATLPVGPVLGTAARAATAGTRFARAGEAAATALGTGGFKTGIVPTRAAIKAGAPTPTIGLRAADMALRAAAGGTTGAVSAGLTGDDAIASALGGALIPTIGSTVARVAADKVILPAWERISGQLGVQRAAAIFRNAFGMSYDDLINLARNAPDDVPFAQVVAQAGAREPTAQALAAQMAKGPGAPILAPLERAQTEAQQRTLSEMAGGATERESRRALVAERQALGETYADAERKAFEQANLGGKVILPLRAAADVADLTAEQKSALARRMAFGAERAETRLGQADDLGDVFDPEAVGRLRGQAGAMGERAETAAQQAIRLREEANAARQQITDLNAQGINALETGPLAAQIRSMARAEGLSKTQRAALNSVAQDIESYGPIIRAGDLDAVRSDANVTIANLLGASADVGGVKKATADLLGRIKGPIDAAIENAGGVGYGAAKKEFATGATELERKQFAGDLAGMFESDPAKFARTVRGARGTTKAVEEAFPRAGRLNFDIDEMMGPSRMPALRDIAQNVELKQQMAQDADVGNALASNLMKNPPQEIDIFHRYSPVGLLNTAGTSALKFMNILSDSGLSAKTQQALAEGFKSGRSAEELLTTLPLADRVQLSRRLMGSDVLNRRGTVSRNAFNTLYGAATAVPDENQNAMAGY